MSPIIGSSQLNNSQNEDFQHFNFPNQPEVIYTYKVQRFSPVPAITPTANNNNNVDKPNEGPHKARRMVVSPMQVTITSPAANPVVDQPSMYL